MSELTQARLKELLDYDPHLGVFSWRKRNVRSEFSRTDNSWNSRYANKPAGHIYGDRERLRISIDKKRYLAHRLAWLWMTGKWPIKEIDHIDLDSLNNKWNNLREATHSQNAMNRRGRGRFGKGIAFHSPSGLYQVRVHANNKCHTIGYFEELKDANSAYASAAKKLHGQFARTD